ncbi:MAG: peptide deformylase [Baekduia sp.]
MTGDATPDLALLEQRFAGIRQWGDPVLRAAARAVERFDHALAAQAAEMAAIMDRAHGAGLAAPQVGIAQRLFVYRPVAEATVSVVVNPVIVSSSDATELGLEGCLSIGRSRIAVEVPRATEVVVEAQDLNGEQLTITATDVHARVLQHEIDHLDGVLMLDRAAPDQRREALRALREGRAWAPEAPPDLS